MFLGSHGALPDTEPARLFLEPLFQRAAALQDGIYSEEGNLGSRRHKNRDTWETPGIAGHQLDPLGCLGTTQNRGQRRQWVQKHSPGLARAAPSRFPCHFSRNNGVLCSGARKSPAAARGAGGSCSCIPGLFPAVPCWAQEPLTPARTGGKGP